jgi:heterodisulfide reductase subunit A-like polyferredoxin
VCKEFYVINMHLLKKALDKEIVRVDNLVIGAGVVGLAVAERLSRTSNQTTYLVEKRPRFGMEVSSRNSEVIHGIFWV